MTLTSEFNATTWQSGLTGQIRVTNSGDALEDWGLAIALDYPIKQRGNGTYELIGAQVESYRLDGDGRHLYEIKPQNYNQSLEAGESVFFVFNADYQEGNRLEPFEIGTESELRGHLVPLVESPLKINAGISHWQSGGATIRLALRNLEEGQDKVKLVTDFELQASSIRNADILEVNENGDRYEYVLQLTENTGQKRYSLRFSTEDRTPKMVRAYALVPESDDLPIAEPEPDEPIVEPPVIEPDPEPDEPIVEPPIIEPPVTNPGVPPTTGEVARPDYNKSRGFFTLDGKIYDANGNEFIARGVNNRHVWFDSYGQTPALNSLDNIAGFGFNSVRIVWEVDLENGIIGDGRGQLTDDNLLTEIIETAIANKMVPMVELHDFTGRNDNQELLDEGVGWWVDRAATWNKYEDSLMINIANEFGDWFYARDNPEQFPIVYKEAITRIREAGINNTIVIDPFNWGKDYTQIVEYGQEILNHDPQKNVVFSLHFYGGTGESPEEIRTAIDAITGQELPLVIGEFGPTHQGRDVREDVIIAEAAEHGIGTYPWAWDDTEWRLGNSWEADSFDELTQFGKDIIFGPGGVQETSELATIFD
ncbi:cellulase (glycosyl hydrolase family 5) with CBM domain [Xenococcus sp. PCC 7305]|uniref:cellulase family glycosylhydrolase n=1 Tax=Xenococcus sp. PCC 7305 TaxID=102125 RepID=UPI0002ABDE57|nr:cellulase family glycosylhydrolase [Xenococcus sp. PCC 7305]ELS01198.1 cellulase (glycosyl hydrolase family 5) with CBM domain [Xenococcus sp. PCC 7305]